MTRRARSRGRAALAAALLAAGAVGTQPLGAQPRATEPLSAIPWLSESIAPEATPPPRRPPDAFERLAPRDGSITVTPLGAVRRDAVGILPPEATGLPRALWGPAPAAEIRERVLAQPDGGVPAAQALFRSLLLAEADPPAAGSASAGTGDAGLLLARIDRLLAIGALEEAGALIERAGPDTPDLFRRWFDVGVLLDRTDAPCAALRDNPTLSPTLPARVFCLARGGDWNAAEITLMLGQGLGAITPEQQALLGRFLDPELFEGEPPPPIPEPLTPLDFLMREAVGLPRPAGPLPLAFLHHDLTDHTPMRAKLVAAERLTIAGAIPHPVLFAAYRSGEPAASGSVWDRAAAVQRLDAALAGTDGDPAATATALAGADAALAARGLRVAFAAEYAPALARLDPEPLGPEARTRLVELLLLGRDSAAAARAAGPAPDARLATLLALAGATPASRAPDDDMPEGDMPEGDRSDGGMPEGDGALARAALAGLADDAVPDERSRRLIEILVAGRTGEAILDALAPLQTGGQVDPPVLQASLLALRRAGQEPAARAIAVQTILPATGA